ncbi:MAG: hypothetical protein LH650_01390 [Chloroflexi bacterium]|nr:hypothetical protein [Chloroflexota bacterium]
MEAPTAARHRPSGVIVVALLQLATIGAVLLSYLSSITLPWEGAFAQAVTDHSAARIIVTLFGVLVVVAAAILFWEFRLQAVLAGIVAIAVVILSDNIREVIRR